MTYVDPVKTSPECYRVLLENEHVRVLEMNLKAGETDEMHSHLAETTYFAKGGKVRVHLIGAEHIEMDVPDGYVMWHEPWAHRIENTGKTDIRAIIFESKRASGA